MLFHFGNRIAGMREDRISFVGARANAEFSTSPFAMPDLDLCLNAAVPSPDRPFAAQQAYVMVAVLGVDSDEYLRGLAIPPLSSIDINSEETGYQAAALLDRLMDGKPPPQRLPEIPLAGVIVRRSTDVLAIDDGDVIRAVQFIREHACRPIRAADVLAELSVSRGLEKADEGGVSDWGTAFSPLFVGYLADTPE